MRIGVAAAGYGDGYPRHAPAGTPVRVNGAAAQVVGRVSMDLMTIDLRGHPDARAGDPVVLWGVGLPIESVRSEEHTSELQYLMRISYAVFCFKKKKNMIP